MHFRGIHFHPFFANKELDEIYASMAIRTFAVSLISIFVPIYLVVQGFSLAQVLLFYAVYHTVHALLTVPSAQFSSHWGFKHAILVSTPLLMIFYVSVYLLETSPQFWVLAAVIGGAMSAFFWTGYHLDFASVGESKSYGRELGMVRVITSVVHLIGPIIGGILLTLYGFNVVFVIVSLLLFVSTIPLFLTKDIHEPIRTSFKGIFSKERLSSIAGYFGHGVANGVDMVVWPIFIFTTIFNDYTEIGTLVALSFVGTLILNAVAGSSADKNSKKTLRIGALVNGAIWVARSMVRTPFMAFTVDFLYGGSLSFVHLTFDAICYERAKKSDLINTIVFREIVLNVARVMAFLAFMLLTSYTPIFLTAAGATLLYMFY